MGGGGMAEGGHRQLVLLQDRKGADGGRCLRAPPAGKALMRPYVRLASPFAAPPGSFRRPRRRRPFRQGRHGLFRGLHQAESGPSARHAQAWSGRQVGVLCAAGAMTAAGPEATGLFRAQRFRQAGTPSSEAAMPRALCRPSMNAREIPACRASSALAPPGLPPSPSGAEEASASGGGLVRTRQDAEAGAAAEAGIARTAGGGGHSGASRSILPAWRGRAPGTLRSSTPEGGQAPPWLPLRRFGAEPQYPCRVSPAACRAPERDARACRSVRSSRLQRARLPTSADRMRKGCAGAPRISLKPEWQERSGRGKQRVRAHACGRPRGQLGECAEKRRPSASRLCQPDEIFRGS